MNDEPETKDLTKVYIPQPHGGSLCPGQAWGNKGGGRKKRDQVEALSVITDKALELLSKRLKEEGILSPSNDTLIRIIDLNLKLNPNGAVVVIDKPKLLGFVGLAMQTVGLPAEVIQAVGAEIKRLIAERDLELLNDIPLLFED